MGDDRRTHDAFILIYSSLEMIWEFTFVNQTTAVNTRVLKNCESATNMDKEVKGITLRGV